VSVQTGSGSVHLYGGAGAGFDVQANQGSGDLSVRYPGASLRRSREKVVGARVGDGRTVIKLATGSGDCVIAPAQ